MKPLESLARRSAVNEGLQQCAQCGGRIPADAPQGLCPRCLLAPAGGGSASPQGSTPTAPVEAGSPPAPAAAASRFTAPDPRELAPLFPQLEILGILGQGGDGGGVPRAPGGARPAGGAEDPAGRSGERPCLQRALRARGAGSGAAEPPTHRLGLRLR